MNKKHLNIHMKLSQISIVPRKKPKKNINENTKNSEKILKNQKKVSPQVRCDPTVPFVVVRYFVVEGI